MKRIAILLLLSIQTATVFWAQEKGFPELTGPYLGQKPPGMTPEVFAPGIISKAGFHLHSSLAFSPDGKEIYFTRIVFEPLTQGTIYCLKQERNRWTEPRIASFSGIFNDDSPSFSPDGQRLYFSSTRPLDAQDQSNDLDIWYVERNEVDWSTPIHAGSPINTDYCDFRASISKNGTMYLSSDRDYRDNKSFDIFVAQSHKGQYSPPKKLDEAITTPFTEQIGYIAPDESYIVFYRYTRDDPDDVGLYISFRKEDGSWTEGKNMGVLFNSPPEAVTQAASLSPDGRYVFFLKRYEEAIYWVDAKVIEHLWPKELK